jgi:CubicO group peptidase (beta-lactamase class C family)
LAVVMFRQTVLLSVILASKIGECIMFIRLLFIISLLAFCGCHSSDSADLQSVMQSIIDTKWGAYANDNMGGNGSIAIYITSPKGDHFLKTGNTSSEITTDSHFRAASTTKTFTAAAIMLLYQQNMLDIDDYLSLGFGVCKNMISDKH